MRKTLIAAVGFIAAFAAASTGQATVITQMLGTADFTDGQTAIGTGIFIANPHGDPLPFNTLIGDKLLMNNNPMTSFTFSAYGTPMASSITSATIEFGLYDGASPSPSTEVKSFTLDGTDNASILTAALVASNPIENGERYYTLTLPMTDFADLATGSSTFFLQFTGPGLNSMLMNTNSILFGLDFATLTINTSQVPPATPEPPSILLLLTGLGGLIFACRILRQPNQALVKA